MTTAPDDYGGLITVMAGHEVTELATYNGERASGHRHTPGYRWRMAVLQWRFNAATREARLEADGGRGMVAALNQHFGWTR